MKGWIWIVLNVFLGICVSTSVVSAYPYVNNECGFELDVPEGWIAKSEPKIDANISVYFVPAGTDFPVSIFIMKPSPLKEGLTVESMYSEKSKTIFSETFKRIWENETTMSERFRDVNGRIGYERVYIQNYQNYSLKVRYIIVVGNNRLYTLEYFTKTDLFDKYDNDFETIVSSFNIRGTAESWDVVYLFAQIIGIILVVVIILYYLMRKYNLLDSYRRFRV